MTQNGLFQVFDGNKSVFLTSKLQITLYHPMLWHDISYLRCPYKVKNQRYHSAEGMDVAYYVEQ